MKLRYLLILSVMLTVLFIAVCLLSAKLPEDLSPQAAAGKKVWQQHNCVSCHTLFGNGGYVAEDLTHIAAKKDSSQLIAYLVQPPVMRPHKEKRHPALTNDEAELLLEYLKRVSTIPTLGWPPQPLETGNGS